jgi:Beta-propeller repeat
MKHVTRPEGRTLSVRRIGVGLAALAAVFAAIAVVPGSGASQQRPDGKLALGAGRYAKLPLSFVRNSGQIDARAAYYAQGPRYGVYFTRRAVDLSFVKGTRGAALSLRFVGASPIAVPEARRTLPGRVNYLVGNRAGWRTDISTYGEIVYRGLWPGIDMAVRGERGTLKYEFLVRPGARIGDIRLAYRGATHLAVSPEGNLLIGTPLGTLTDGRPVSYQRIGGRRVAVPSRYVLDRGGYGFAVGNGYDPRHPLVIDPELAYSTYLGGPSFDLGTGIAVDEDGYAYVTGPAAASFPTTPGAFQPANAGDRDVLVAKLNRSGSALLYATYVGGSGFDWSNDIAVDEGGRAYVTGITESSDFPTTPGAFQATDPDPTPGFEGSAGFVAKLDRSGSGLVYSTYLGGTSGASQDSLNGIAVDSSGNAYVAGSVCTSSYPTTSKAFQPADPTPGPCDDSDRPANNTVVVSKLDPSGSALVYSTYFGGTSFINVNSMTIDDGGNVYLTGPVDGTFPSTPKAFQAADPSPGTDAFVAKLNGSGSKLVYSTYLGGSSTDEGGIGIGVDAAGFAYVAGRTGSADFPTTAGAYDRTLSGADDAFFAKLNQAGSSLVYSTLFGGSGIEEPHFSVALDGEGRAFTTGVTNSLDLPTTAGAPQSAYGGGSLDGFVAVLNRSGSGLTFSSYLGGAGRDVPASLALDGEGAAYVTGSTRSADFPTTAGVFETTDPNPSPFSSGTDGFVTKFDTGEE